LQQFTLIAVGKMAASDTVAAVVSSGRPDTGALDSAKTGEFQINRTRVDLCGGGCIVVGDCEPV